MVTQNELDELILRLAEDRIDRESLRSRGQQGTDAVSVTTVSEVLPELAKALRDQGAPMASYLDAVGDDERAALVIGSSAIHCALSGYSAHRAIAQLGATVSFDLWASALEKQHPDVYKKVAQLVERRGHIQFKRRSAKAIATRIMDAEPGELVSQRDRMALGRQALQALLAVDALILHEIDGQNHVAPSTRLSERLNFNRHRAIMMSPVAVPMVTAPREWRGITGGGYHSRLIARSLPLVRSGFRGTRVALGEAADAGVLEEPLRAVSYLQSVPLEIDREQLRLLHHYVDKKLQIGGMPHLSVMPRPELPEGWDDLDNGARRNYRKRLEEVHAFNVMVRSETLVVNRDLAILDMLRDQPIYLPHQCDWRGRVYPMPTLSHHRGDHVRALFRFAEGQELGYEGVYWLAYAAATLGDFERTSKATADVRVQWTYDHEEELLLYAASPLQNTGWQQADKPFQFLAACREWAAFVASGRDPHFVSGLPIALDASNSGLQHYAAMMRSERDARLVNLIPSETMQDVYGTVANRVIDALMQMDTQEAREWLAYGVTRSTVKRCVMTYAYSSNRHGFANHLVQDIIQPLEHRALATGQPVPFTKPFKACVVLAGLIFEVTEAVVSSAAAAMKFLRGIAGQYARRDLPVVWETPLGWPCVQYTYKLDPSTRVRLTLDYRGSRRRIGMHDLSDDNRPMDASKARNAIGPNFIHSHDACHLMMTALAMKEKSCPLITVHDSFATPAATAGVLFDTVRKTFAELYTDYDPLTDLWLRARVELGDDAKLPEVPLRGALDVRQVLNSAYAFS